MKRNGPNRVTEVPPEHEDLRPLIEAGYVAKLPNAGPDWQLPELIEVEGESASQALIRMRGANCP